MHENFHYPAILEQAWLDHACKLTGTPSPRAAVARLENAAGDLSDAFTTGRDPGFYGYQSKPQALAAYGLFFFPRSFVRTTMVLEECRDRMRPPAEGKIRIADLGAGTGAAGLAALAAYATRWPDRPLHIDMVDRASDSLHLAQMLFAAGESLWPKARLQIINHDARSADLKGSYDVIICSFAINEWMEGASTETLTRWTEHQLRHLNPGGLFIIMDPALRSSVDRIVALRDWVAAERIARLVAPCSHVRPCPMRAEKRGWCHEVREWVVPASMRLINRNLQRDIHLLKFSFLVLANEKPADTVSGWARLVSPVSPEKGKFTGHACASDGKIHKFEWLTRGLTSEQHAASESLHRGDRIVMPEGTVLGDGVTERIKIPPGLF